MEVCDAEGFVDMLPPLSSPVSLLTNEEVIDSAVRSMVSFYRFNDFIFLRVIIK